MDSVWAATATLPTFDALREDIKTDVCVVGGGLAGLLCCYRLTQAGIDSVLVEADRLCGGVTKNTTAKITLQHGLVYDKLLRQFGKEKTQQYLLANKEALEQYRALCETIACGFEEKDAYVYSLDDRKKLEKELTAYEILGYPAVFAEQVPLPLTLVGAVKCPRQAQFHPLQFAAAIAKGLRIYEQTKVRELVGKTVVTSGGRIRANAILVATHFPFLNKHGGYFIRIYQHRSYVLALENAPDVQGMYVDENEKGMSFRNYENLLLLGGGDHRTGKKGGCWQEPESFAARNYPSAREKYRWATQDCMTLDGVPYIGAYSAGTRGLYVATGFNKWGMTGSMVAATLLTDLVQGKKNPYAPVFSPQRSSLHPQLACNLAESAVSLLTPTQKRCPHLGCALHWNAAERSWDCPCHGSRFTQDGKLLNNPATGNLKNPKGVQ